MKTLSIYVLAAIAILLAGCSSPVKIAYDENTNFEMYKTYAWTTDIEGVNVDEETIRNVKESVNLQLAAKGLTEVSRRPDFYISLDILEELVWDEDYSYPDLRYRYRSYKSRGGLIWTNRYEQIVLDLEFVSADTRSVIWKGSVKEVLDPVQFDDTEKEQIGEAVSNLLIDYPPTEKK